MSDDFDRVFGGRTDRPITFTERVGRQPAATDDASREDGLYKPFGFLPTGVGETCDVRRWIDGTNIPEGLEFPYRLLMQVSYVGDEQLRLMLPDCIVVIEGRGLTALRQKLARRQVTFVQQFHPGIWTGSSDGDTVIERIDVVRSLHGSERDTPKRREG